MIAYERQDILSELPPPPPTTRARTIARYVLAAAMIYAGLSHLFWAREEFQAQVPQWVPMDADGVVMASGGVEITLGLGLVLLSRDRVLVGRLLAVFFVLIFPGNIAQFVDQVDGFGLNSDTSRFIRLLFQPVLIAWALWATGIPRSKR
ncbi:DoxX family protein [Mycobacterium sp. SMC-4]|uniref:DoxX family protein n=1 Tax=Mycobacterium sp. SMC-4 TaxID=2857059 RepID=UPI003CFE6C89